MESSKKNYSSTLNLREIFEEGRSVFDENPIEHRKEMNVIRSKARKFAKGDKCLYCGKAVTSFCNSHTIPAFILKRIAVDGYLYNFNKMIEMPLLDMEDGVNKSGTFHVICRECDSSIFSDYEEPVNYKYVPTEKMLSQIAMKNYLRSIYKRKLELEINKIQFSESKIPEFIYNQAVQVNKLDSEAYQKAFDRAKRANLKDWKNQYYMFFCQRLPYVVPLAFQGPIALITDFDGNLVNKMFNLDPKYKIENMHLCIFPLEDESLIFMFVDGGSKRYRKFYKQFNRLTAEEQQKAMVFILFAYTEDFFIHKNLDESVLSNKVLLEVSAKTAIVESLYDDSNSNETVRDNYRFTLMNDIPNLLGKEYMIQSK